ncbi:MAG: phage major tail tube protein [Hyphomicrobiales bacterium]|nr:phage major tail tube protein [Hyphomicrobiales bacterium]MDE2113816.1 phage major tail tube protein [Hyphomicrobiales bacterium]
MANMDYVVKAFALFVDGIGKAGTGEKVALPKIEAETEMFRGGGMLGGVNVPHGYKPIKMTFELNSFDPQVITQSDIFGKRAVAYSIRGFADGDGGKQHTIIFQGTGLLVTSDPGEWAAGKKVALKGEVDLTAATLTVDGTVLYDIDLLNDVYIFNGVDTYAPVRAALGL